MSPVPDSQNKWFAALERIAETIRTERQCTREAAWAYAVAEHSQMYDLYSAVKLSNPPSRAVEPNDTQREWDKLSRGLPISKQHWDVQVVNGQTVGFRRGARA